MYKPTTTPFRKSCTISLISHRFVVANKKAYYRGFLLPEHIYMPMAIQRNLMKGVYIYARGSHRVKLATGELIFDIYLQMLHGSS